MIKVGIDTGGTFTDFILVDGERIRTLKLLSQPDDPARAVLEGLKELLQNRSGDYPAEFHRRHQHRYGYADPSRESEIVTLRVRARGISQKPRVPKNRPAGPDPKSAEIKRKNVYFEGKAHSTRVYERARLRAGNKITGPALIFEYSASSAIPPGYACTVDGYRNLILEPR